MLLLYSTSPDIHSLFQFFSSPFGADWSGHKSLLLLVCMKKFPVESVASHEAVPQANNSSHKDGLHIYNIQLSYPGHKSIPLLPNKTKPIHFYSDYSHVDFQRIMITVALCLPGCLKASVHACSTCFSELRLPGCSPRTFLGVTIKMLMVSDGSDIIKVHLEARVFGKHYCIYLHGRS